MDWMTIGGIGGSMLTVILGILFTNANLSSYVSSTSLFITFGGSFGAMVAMNYQNNVRKFFQIFYVFRSQTANCLFGNNSNND